MARLALLLALLASLPVTPQLVAAPVRLEDYAGDWEILILTSSTFRAGALALEARDGRLAGELVWRWGSVQPLPADAVRLGGGGELIVRAPELKRPMTLRRHGDAIEGSLEEEGGKATACIGRLARHEVNPVGTWDLVARVRGEEEPATLEIRDEGARQLRARARLRDGQELAIDEARVEGNRLELAFRSADGARSLRFQGEIRGDRIAGRAGEAGQEGAEVTGTRRRQWGKPISLLSGDGTAGWRARDPQAKFGWTCAGGVLTNAPPDVDIESERHFRDFKLHLEYRVAKGGNSGVYLRGRYEVQILDDWREGGGPVESHGNGAVYSRIPQSRNVSRPPETWQAYDITLIDRYLTVVLNGETIVDNARLKGITGGALWPFTADAGPLMLQGDHGKISYRNIVVTPALPPGLERSAPVAGKAEEAAWRPLFPADGEPKGWAVRAWNDVSAPAPAGAAWKVEGGVLRGSTPRGSWLVSEELFGDFELEFEWKLGERGNSGCGLRFPGKGDPAFDGLELQMVDPRYYPPEQAVTPGELTGSLYKAVAPPKQLFQPLAWNRYQVRCVGAKVEVALNGERILDVDLERETQPAKRHDNTDAPPLRDRPRRGHIGFQELSRGDSQVQIRGARLRSLDPR